VPVRYQDPNKVILSEEWQDRSSIFTSIYSLLKYKNALPLKLTF